jgi:hypothetical protein
MSGLELGKAAASAGAWAWKCRLETRREARFENPFTDFLKRRWGRVGANPTAKKRNICRPALWNEFDWGKAALNAKS